MIERTFRTRGYECDATRTVPLPVVFSYLEHVRWEWIQLPELGLAPLLHQGYFFVVQRQTAEIVRRVGMSTDIQVRGAFKRVGRSQAIVRQVVIRKSDGALLVDAQVVGCWLGPNRKLARIPNETREVGGRDNVDELVCARAHEVEPAVGGVEASLIAPPEIVYQPLGLDLPLPKVIPEDAIESRVVVRPSDLDIFDHVNASNWLRLVDDARVLAARSGHLSPLALNPSRRAAIDHPREACLGDELTIHTWPVDATHFAAMITLQGDIVCRASVTVAD